MHRLNALRHGTFPSCDSLSLSLSPAPTTDTVRPLDHSVHLRTQLHLGQSTVYLPVRHSHNILSRASSRTFQPKASPSDDPTGPHSPSAPNNPNLRPLRDLHSSLHVNTLSASLTRIHRGAKNKTKLSVSKFKGHEADSKA
jgi:hypothetical protein